MGDRIRFFVSRGDISDGRRLYGVIVYTKYRQVFIGLKLRERSHD